MAISIYDQPNFARYTPLSAQEILLPGQILREEHNKLDEEYAQINDNLQRAAFIAQNDPDENIRNRYTNYNESLVKARDTLMKDGLNASSRRSLYDLRGKFQKDISPLISGYELKKQDIDNYNKMLMNDPTFIGVNPSTRSVGEYVNNGLQSMTPQGYSGTTISKQVADAAKNLSDRLNSDPQFAEVLQSQYGLGAQYIEVLRNRGINPEDLNTNPILQQIVGDVLQSTGILQWGNPEQIQRAYDYARQGLYQSIGKTEGQFLSNKDYDLSTALYKQALKGAQNNSGGNGITFNTLPADIRTIDNEVSKQYVDTIKDKLSGKTNQRGIISQWAKGIQGAQEIRDIASNPKATGTASSEARAAVELENLYRNNPQSFDLATQKLQEDLIKRGYLDAGIAQATGAGVLGYVTTAGAALNAGVTAEAILATIPGATVAVLPLITTSDERQYNPKKVLDYFNTLIEDIQIDEDIANIKAEFPGASDNEIINLLEDDLRYKSALFNTRYTSNSASVRTYEKNSADRLLLNAGNQYSIIRDKKGKVTTVGTKDAPFKLEEIQKDANYIGHTPYNPDLKSPSYDYQIVKDNDTYTISIPATDLTQSYGLYNAVIESILRPFTKEKTIEYNGEKFKISKGRKGEPNYIIEDINGNKLSLEQLRDLGRQGVAREYYIGSTPRSKVDSTTDIDYYDE